MAQGKFRDSDYVQLSERGIEPAEALRQLGVLSQPPRFARLVRPATVGDGIVRVAAPERDRWLAAHRRAQAAGRFTKFVPSSGAATRMFRDLLHYHAGSGAGQSPDAIESSVETEAAVLRRVLDKLQHFAFHDELRDLLAARGESLSRLISRRAFAPILAALLEETGLGYAHLPKGLLLFHRLGGDSRTPFEEHLAEADSYVRGSDDRCRLHFTVSPEHQERFEALLQKARAAAGEGGARFEVEFSVQKPSTDTLALDAGGDLVRDGGGELLFRPAGHGALIENLAELGADLVFIKNIDNVQPESARQTTLQWKQILGGYLVVLQERVFAALSALRAGAGEQAEAEAERFVRETLNADPGREFDDAAARRAWLIDRLDRPLRVCGVVPNTGEPGGGPFWVAGEAGGATPQIVEGAQVDAEDGDQRAILGGSTHFNPVDLVCALRDVEGRAHDLHRFVDPATAIITRKSAQGRELIALERPGLWNGAMARWNTVFVEVPIETFTPVKTILDLLRPEHQGS